MTKDQFFREIDRIFQVAWIQNSTKLVLRAAWLGGAVYLVFWGMHRLGGWFPDQRVWLVTSLMIFILILSTIFWRRKPDKKFVWRLDQKFSLQEQLYTLFEHLVSGEAESENNQVVEALLVSEEISSLPKIRRDLVDKGWQLKAEFEATFVVLILLLIVYLTSVSSISHVNATVEENLLPPLGVDPSADKIFPSGIPGERGNQSGMGEDSVSEELTRILAEMNLNFSDWPEISKLMRELGEKLRLESGTYEVGEALAEEDYKSAAIQFGSLAENADMLSREVQFRIADQFLATAVELGGLGQEKISAYFQVASAALFEGSIPKIFDGLNGLADLMELFAQWKSKEEPVQINPNSTALRPQSLDQYQNNMLIIEINDDIPDYVSAPREGGSEGENVLNESSDFILPLDSNMIEGLWLPFQFYLEDSDVVSTYFSPR